MRPRLFRQKLGQQREHVAVKCRGRVSAGASAAGQPVAACDPLLAVV